MWLLFLDFAVILSYGAALFFTNWPILAYGGLRVAVGYSALLIVLHFILNLRLRSNPSEVFEATIFLNTCFLFFIIDYFGGPSGFIFPLLYIFVIGSFFFGKRWGIISTFVSFSYLLIYSFLLHSNNLLTPSVYIPFFSLLISGIGGFWLGEQTEGMRQKNVSLDKVADKLTTEKSQDEAVLSAIADGVYAVDMNRNLVLWNKAAADLTSWEEADVLGLKCSTVMKLLKEDDISVCEKDCPALQVWNTGEPVFRNNTCFVNRKNKKRVQLSSSYAPIKDLDGKMSGAICVFHDITKEKEVERLRNEFVSTASHELRTPITATEGYLSIITDSGLVKIDDKGKEFIQKARGTLLGMSKLIQNLLAVTKIEEGKLETNVVSFSIHDLVKEIIDVFTPAAKDKGIELVFVESKSLGLKGKKAVGRSLNVRADKEMIKEVLNNLVENAIKFTPKGTVSVTIDYDEEFATINIEDTGIGIPEEAKKHLFEKFYRADNTATREIGGTGLGLYITRSIVETFGGRIWAESFSGKGSKFHFTVPLSLD